MAQIIITAIGSGGSRKVARDTGAGEESWATIRAGAGTAMEDSVWAQCYTHDAALWSLLSRSILQFSLTDALLTGATITGITFRLNIGSIGDVRGLHSRIVNATPAGNPLVNEDYSQVGTTAYCDTDITHATIGTGDKDFTLNAAGIAAAQAAIGGIFKLGGRLVEDINNTAPTLSQGTNDYLTFSQGNTKVIIDYTPGSSIKKVAGVAKASITKVMNIAIASVKKLLGIT